RETVSVDRPRLALSGSQCLEGRRPTQFAQAGHPSCRPSCPRGPAALDDERPCPLERTRQPRRAVGAHPWCGEIDEVVTFDRQPGSWLTSTSGTSSLDIRSCS